MFKGKKFLLWITGGTGVLLILLFALSFLLPRLIDLDSVREKIKTGISQKIAGTVDFQKIEITLFPRPMILINRASFSFPGRAEGTIDSLKIYPSLLPLFSGKVQIGTVQTEGPRIALTVPVREKDKKKPPLSVREIEEKASAFLKTLASNAPDTRIGIRKGSVRISDYDRPLFSFQDIEGQIVLPPGKAGITLTCSSSISKSMSLGMRLDPETLKGIGSLKLTGMKPHLIVQPFFPDFVRRLEDSEANLMLSFKMLGFKDLRAEVHGSFPYLTFLNNNERVPLKGIGIHAAIVQANGKTEITLNELKLEYPQLSLSGTLVVDKTAQNVSMEISGSRVDVLSLRNVSLPLAGELPIVQNIFAYVRGGKIPFITVHSQGTSLEDLGKTESIIIKGRMQQGEILVPGPQLDFKGVNGDCTISKGILDGVNVEGILGNSQMRDGKLRVGLKGSNVPLHIDAAVRADLAEARDTVKRLLKDGPLPREIDLIKAIHGEAKGRIILGENTASIKPRVDLSEVSFTTEYQRIPLPLVIKGGQFSYDGTRISVKKLRGSLGRSSIMELTGELRLGDVPFLEVPSGKMRIVHDEIYPWLKSSEGMKGSLDDLRSLRGSLNLDTINLKGPLLKPREWHFRLTGSMEDLVIDGAFLPSPASLKKGSFDVTEEKISLTDVRTEILDASVALSGIQQGYLGGRRKTDLTFQGTMGPRSFGWAAKLASLPSQFSLRDSVTFEHAHIALEEGSTLFQGSFQVQNGPKITADVLKHSKGLAINKLTIKDTSSDTTLSLGLEEKTLSLAFAGVLSPETLAKLLAEQELHKGRIAGDFRVDIKKEKPFLFTASGKARAEDIVIPSIWGIPIRIENLSFAGSGNSLSVEPSSIRVGDTPLSLKGNLNSTRGDLTMEMELSADRIEWERITGILDTAGKREGKENNSTLDIPVNGTLRVKVNQFTYGEYALMPLHADISFHRDDMNIAVTRAALCGISSPGTINITPRMISFDFHPTAENQELKSAIDCLAGKNWEITGRFDFKGNLKGQGRKETLMDSLLGDMELIAKEGRVYQEPSLLNILSFLQIEQILRGFPDMREEGIDYKSLRVKAELTQNTLRISEGILVGPSIKIAAQGSIDLKNGKLDSTVLVSPLTSADTVLSKMPVIGGILGGSLVSIPLEVSGDLENPKVGYHPVSAVGSGLLGIMQRTLKTPVKLFDPFLLNGKK